MVQRVCLCHCVAKNNGSETLNVHVWGEHPMEQLCILTVHSSALSSLESAEATMALLNGEEEWLPQSN